MKYSLSSFTKAQTQNSWSLPIFDNFEFNHLDADLPKAFIHEIQLFLKKGDFEGKLGDTWLLHNLKDGPERLLLVGLGKRATFDDSAYIKAVEAQARAIKTLATKKIATFLPSLSWESRNYYWKVRQLIEQTTQSLYTFNEFKSKPKTHTPQINEWILPTIASSDQEAGKDAIAHATAISDSLILVKNLANRPANVCTPSHLADEAKALAKEFKSIKVKVLETKDIAALGMGAFLAVARGSEEPAKFIILEYHGTTKKIDPIVFVGKGVTFDSGGISIKPSERMEEMKFDMCGAATVLGVLRAAADLKLPTRIVGLIPTTENLPDGRATKPGDIVKSLSGQTIEIINTDAEGRLILCDALTYSLRFKPKVVIDIATLTGACVVALGTHATGLFSNDDALANALISASDTTLDRAWRLPLWESYQEQLENPYADMSNVGGREAGAITAACFLWNFTKNLRWAHLDVAGTAWRGRKEKGPTGRPVPMLVQYLLDNCGEAKNV